MRSPENFFFIRFKTSYSMRKQCPMCPYTSDTSNVLEEHINRSHFDPVSPSLNAIIAQRSAANDANPTAADSNGGDAHHQHLNASSRPSSEHQHQQQHQPANSTLTALACPICGRAFEAASSLELHVNIEHRFVFSFDSLTSHTVHQSIEFHSQ